MKKKIAVLSCGWDYDFLKDFISGIESAAKDKNTDVYVFNAYNFIESVSHTPGYTSRHGKPGLNTHHDANKQSAVPIPGDYSLSARNHNVGSGSKRTAKPSGKRH